MSKTYTLEIILDQEGGGIREKTSEGLNIHDARQIIAILEEYKQKMMTYVMFSQQQTDLKKNTKQ